MRPDSASHDDPYSHPRAAEPRVASACVWVAPRTGPRRPESQRRVQRRETDTNTPPRTRCPAGLAPRPPGCRPRLPLLRSCSRPACARGTLRVRGRKRSERQRTCTPRVSRRARADDAGCPGSTTATRWWVSALGVVGRQDGRWRARRPGWAAPTAAVVRRPRTSCCSA